jgi:hypothetical protein
MKKIIVLIVIVLGLSGCGSSETLDASQNLRVNESLVDVRLTVMNEVQRDSEQINLELWNDTSFTLTYGEAFAIEFYDEGVWRSFPIFAEFPSIGYGLEPGSTSALTRHLNWFFPEGLPYAGRYRIRMDIFNDADIPITEDDIHDVVAEFYVE